MDKPIQVELAQLRTDLRRLEKVVTMLLQRNQSLEKQIRSIKSNAHLAGLSVNGIQRQLRQG